MNHLASPKRFLQISLKRVSIRSTCYPRTMTSVGRVLRAKRARSQEPPVTQVRGGPTKPPGHPPLSLQCTVLAFFSQLALPPSPGWRLLHWFESAGWQIRGACASSLCASFHSLQLPGSMHNIASRRLQCIRSQTLPLFLEDAASWNRGPQHDSQAYLVQGTSKMQKRAKND